MYTCSTVIVFVKRSEDVGRSRAVEHRNRNTKLFIVPFLSLSFSVNSLHEKAQLRENSWGERKDIHEGHLRLAAAGSSLLKCIQEGNQIRVSRACSVEVLPFSIFSAFEYRVAYPCSSKKCSTFLLSLLCTNFHHTYHSCFLSESGFVKH